MSCTSIPDRDAGPRTTGILIVVGPQPVQGTKEAVTISAATRPVDVSTTGSAAKVEGPPVTTAPRDWKASAGAQIAGGILAGVYGFVKSNAVAVIGLTISPERVAQQMQMTGLQAALAEHQRGGGVFAAGAAFVNTANPFYQLGVTGVDTANAAEKGDYWNAAKGATTIGLAVAAVVVGGKLGAPEGAGDVPTPSSGAFAEGEFSLIDTTGYPQGAPLPTGVFRMLTNPEYAQARLQANAVNRALHKVDPSLKGMHIHEIKPVKFGGSPTDLSNKISVTPAEHSAMTNFWNRLQRDIEEP
jgi:hypothetical protein